MSDPCPNCGRDHDGLYVHYCYAPGTDVDPNVGDRHCGCFYTDIDPAFPPTYHVSRDCLCVFPKDSVQ